MRLFKQLITLVATAQANEDVVESTIYPPAGRLVGIALKVPAMGAAEQTAKVQLANPNDSSLIYFPDNVIGTSGACAASATTIGRFSSDAATAGAFYPLPVDNTGVKVTITASANQAANRIYTLYLLVD